MTYQIHPGEKILDGRNNKFILKSVLPSKLSSPKRSASSGVWVLTRRDDVHFLLSQKEVL